MYKIGVLAVLIGCNSNSTNPTNTDPPAAPIPTLRIDSYEDGVPQPIGPADVKGTAIEMSDITLNGEAITPTNGAFTASTELVRGLNVLDLHATAAEGPVRRIRSVLAGDFTPTTGPVSDAVVMKISSEALSTLTPVIAASVDSTALAGQVTSMNPVYDDNDILVNIDSVIWDAPIVSLVPTQGALEISITLPNFRMPLSGTYDAGWFDIDVDGDITADTAIFTTSFTLQPDGNGSLDVGLVDSNLEITNFEIDINNVPDFLEDLVLDDAEMLQMLQDQVDTLLADLPAMTDGLLSDLDLATETELLGSTLAIDPVFSDAGIDPSGIFLNLDIGIDVVGAAESSYLTVGTPSGSPSDQLLVALSDDFMNRALVEIWSGGALDIDLPVEAGSLQSALLVVFGGQQGESGALKISAGLPPVLVDVDGVSRLQLGNMSLTVETPGGEFGDSVELDMVLDAKSELQLGDGSVGIRLSNTNITLAPLTDNPALVEKLPQLETTMGVGMGALNSMLSFPLDMELPPIEVRRAADGKATLLAIDLSAIDFGALLGGAQPPPQ